MSYYSELPTCRAPQGRPAACNLQPINRNTLHFAPEKNPSRSNAKIISLTESQ